MFLVTVIDQRCVGFFFPVMDRRGAVFFSCDGSVVFFM